MRAFREAPTLRRGLGVTVLLSILGTAGQLVVPMLVQQIIDNDLLIEGGPEPHSGCRSKRGSVS